MGEFAPRVCFPFVGRDVGGSHFSSLGLIRGIDRRRYEPLVLLQHLDGPVYEFFKDHGVPAAPAPASPVLRRGAPIGVGSKAALLASAPRLAQRLREDSFALVHCNDGRTSATWALAGKLAGVKVVWHNRGNPGAAGLRFVAPFLADAVVSVSRFASPRPGLISAAAKNTVIFSPFDTDVAEDRDSARSTLVEELRIDPRSSIIGYFGALVARKRPLLFVDALAEIRKREPGLPIVGLMFGAARDGLDREVEKRAAECGVSDLIHQMGFRSPGSRWIAACDFLLSPGVGEPLGRTLVEAMLVGTPVIAADSGGNPEALRPGETGVLTPPENAGALADAVLTLIKNQSLSTRIAAAARADALARFGADRHVEAIMRLYDDLLSAKAARRGAPFAAGDLTTNARPRPEAGAR